MTAIEKPGFCTLCRSRCGTISVVENDRLVSVRPNPAHPTGRALCPKGRAAPEIAHSARRLTTPLRRTAPRGAEDPGFVPVSWDEALAEIADRLGRYKAETGPESVAFAVTSGASSSISDSVEWIQRLIRGFGSPNTVYSTEICNWHKDYAHAFTFGCALPMPDYGNADLILLWGHNPANVWLSQAEAIGAARTRGARLAVIDPRRAGSARDADLWLRIRPGTDAALALGLARLLIADAAYDAAFVRHRTNAAFLVRDDTGLFLRPGDLGEDGDGFLVWDPRAGRAVPAATGLAEALLDARVTVAGRDGPVACRTAFAHYRAAAEPYDPATVAEITGIPAAEVEGLARAIATARSVCYYGWTGIGQHTNATQTERAIATLYALTGHYDAPGGNVRMPAHPVPALHAVTMIPPETRARALGLAKRPIGPPAEGWITSTDFYDAALTGRPYRVRALVAFGSNLVVSHPAGERGRAALQALDFQVHCDLFLNPTAEMADIVLPVSGPWEHEALRIGFDISPEAQEWVQLRPQMIPRQDDARSDLWIVFQLARRLGLSDLFFDGDVELGFSHLLAPLGLDLATLRAHPEGVRVPLAQGHRPTAFATQTGKAELYSELLHRHGYPPVPRHVPPADAPDPSFPLTLFSANAGEFCHSQHRGITGLRRRREEPRAEIHPALARRNGIAAGDWMLVRTRHGRIRLRAALNDALAEDVVAAEYGWWQAAPDLGLPGYREGEGIGSNFNALIAERERDPVSGSLALRSAACTVEHLGAEGWDGWRSFVVTDRREEGPEVVALTLRPADGAPLPAFRPGQSIGLRLGDEVRSYSLIGPAAPAADAYRIAVRTIAGGRVSGALRRDLVPGAVVALQAPRGRFVLPLRNEFPVVLIAGGIGVTPFLSYLETLAGGPGEPEVTLHYGFRDDDPPFRDTLERLRRRLPNLTVVTHPSRIGRFRVADLAPDLVARRARFYLCAGEAMMAEVTAGLRAAGVPPFEIFTERFRSPPPPATDDLAPRRVVFARSGRTLTWRPGANPPGLLAAAERAGLDIPSGCRVGQCESCAVAVTAGRVRHLVACDDLGEGQCLTCQAVPLTDLVLDA
ncbi:molybdopterin-dependent oxidoreductase [uncultured Methylobacterium sp.]|jgi:anaerobic selenocysteine-containing dehydrogenase/ferredoxin-NADP reductase|uniref:molybdopterin-dependent oxidoreductase n=1 Tax=uncultured Methylobacterium sp. TaxID=157278 RepID=UPI00261AE7DB|nr:molybdopterin-dependent oxidoreductase [uncultured Methylobacterium sp.]